MSKIYRFEAKLNPETPKDVNFNVLQKNYLVFFNLGPQTLFSHPFILVLFNALFMNTTSAVLL